VEQQPADPANPNSTVEAPSGEPAGRAPEISSADMNAWIRERAFGPSAPTSNPDGVVPTAELGSPPPGEPAPAPGDVSPGGPPSGRRSARHAAALTTIEELRAHIAELEASIPEQVAEATRQAEAARGRLAEIEGQNAVGQKAIYELIGTPEELQTLMEMPEEALTNEDYLKRETWKRNRVVYRPLASAYKAEADRWAQAVRNGWGQRVLELADRLGLDRAFLADPKNSDINTLIEHAAAVTEARVRAEYAEREAGRQRSLDTARGQALSGMRTGAVNGQASAGSVSATDMDDWIRQRAGIR